MEARFTARNREIEQDAKIAKGCLARANQRLEKFLRPFGDLLPRSETRENALVFVRGLLSDWHRKNTESIAYRFPLVADTNQQNNGIRTRGRETFHPAGVE